jgi:TolB protein
MNADGTGQRNLTNNPYCSWEDRDSRISSDEPAWSPDGRKIAFRRSAWGSGGKGSIWLIGIDGSGLDRLTSDPADDHDPAWSPDGRQIAFCSGRSETTQVYVMNADGSGQRAVTAGAGYCSDPAWWAPAH